MTRRGGAPRRGLSTIPAETPTSTGALLHPDYHTERDRPEKLRYGKMTRVVRMVHQLSWDLAANAGRPAYVPR